MLTNSAIEVSYTILHIVKGMSVSLLIFLGVCYSCL